MNPVLRKLRKKVTMRYWRQLHRASRSFGVVDGSSREPLDGDGTRGSALALLIASNWTKP